MLNARGNRKMIKILSTGIEMLAMVGGNNEKSEIYHLINYNSILRFDPNVKSGLTKSS